MALPLVAAGAALGLASGFIGAGAARDEAAALQNALQQGLISAEEYQQQAQALQERYAAEAQQMLAPGQEAYAAGLQQYQEFLDPTAQAEYAKSFLSSDLGRNMARQAEQTTARTAAATGALRTSDTANALAAIRPQLMQQAVGQRFSGLQGLVNMGAPAVSQGANIYSNLGSQVGQQVYGLGQMGMQAAPMIGQAEGQQQTAYTNAIAGGLGDLGGLAMYGGLA